MEIENLVKETVRFFGGIKSSLPQGALNSTDAEDCVNFVTRRGRLRKLWGTTKVYDSGYGTGRIQWISRLQDRWVAQHGNSIIREQSLGGNDFQIEGDISLGESNPVRSAKWENRLFLVNGSECKFLEKTRSSGFLYRTLGLIPPGRGARSNVTQPTIVLSEFADPSSGLVSGQTYGYVVTWWDDRTQTESLPWGSYVNEDGLWVGAAYGYAYFTRVTLSASNKGLRIDISDLKARGYDTDRVTHFIVYRWTQADNTALKRCNFSGDTTQGFRIPIANNSFDDLTAEADLGAVLDQSLSPPPSSRYYEGLGVESDVGNYGARFVEFYRDQLWMFGVRFPGTSHGVRPTESGIGAETEIEWSPQSGILYGSEVGNPDYWKYTYDIGKSTGQADTGLVKHNTTLMMFKSGSSYRVLGTNPGNYEVGDLDPNKGITVPGSLSNTTIGAIGIGQGGFTLFDGNGPGVYISDELADYVGRINMDYADQISAAFDPVEEKYECSVPLDDATYNTHVFSLDCKTKTWSVTRRVFGAAMYDLVSDVRPVSLLGNPRNGRLYDASDYSKVTLDGETMHGSWRSKAFDFGLPGDLKNVQMIEITARARFDFRISVDLVIDFGQSDAAGVENHPPNLRGDVWASGPNDDTGMKWDHGQWSSGSEKKKFSILIQGIGKAFNLIIRNSDSDADRASFEIEEVVVHASRLTGDNDG